jgi:hypothetical protein
MKRVEIELVPEVYLARSTLTLLKIVGKSVAFFLAAFPTML